MKIAFLDRDGTTQLYYRWSLTMMDIFWLTIGINNATSVEQKQRILDLEMYFCVIDKGMNSW